MINGAIFDMDGTILDSMPFWKHVGTDYLSGMGLDAKPGLAKVLFPMSMDEVAEYLHGAYLPHIPQTEIIDGINGTIYDYYLSDAPLKPGVMGLIKAFRDAGVHMILATSTDRPSVENALSRLGILGVFKDILTCSEIGVGKIKPDIYLRAAELIGSEPGDVWVFEDALHAAKSAKSAGFTVVGIYDEASAENQIELIKTSDHYLADFSDLHEILEIALK